MIVLFFACVLLDPAPQPVGEVRFPHPEGFDEGHGALALELGTSACLDCHVEGATAPTCASCHEHYPHAEGWVAGSVHGQQKTCLGCHKAEGSEVSCTSCHASYPHAAGWAEAGVHGAYALKRPDSAVVCGPCHGDDLRGGAIEVGCSSCHESYPHAEGWESAHGEQGAEGAEDCIACHTDPVDATSWTGGISGVACARCHSSYPHSEDWPSGHIAGVSVSGEAVCMRCHEPGDGPEQVPCGASCHGGAE